MTVVTASPPLERLKTILAEIADIKHAESVLDWDARVSMPHAGAQARAEASAALTRLSHERFVSDEVGQLLEASRSVEEEDPDSVDAALVRVTRREWDRAHRVPTDLAGEMSHASGVAVAAWDEAKAASDFKSFIPHLERQLELKHRYIECFPETETAYDVLLEDYEEGLTTGQVNEVFDRLKQELVPLIEPHREHAADDAPLRGPFPLAGQEEAGRLVLAAFGFDPASWRIDETPHPFASKPGLGDIRLTTHSDEKDLSSLFSTMHEFGHGVYEFDVDPAFARTPLGHGTSSAVHESQSRTWENLVGRSRPFWIHWYEPLQSTFPDQLGDVSLDTFVAGINRARPGFIRVEADETTYSLHIILRFRLERQLIEGTLEPKDVREAWKAGMKELLGVEVPDDANGVLQDTHWSSGGIGYFPTYALGNVLSLQIWAVVQEAMPDLDAQLEAGELLELSAWLRDNLYSLGRKFKPMETLEKVTGSSRIDPEPYLAYLREKQSAVSASA
jgi:carboxypeptidase Taq